MQLPNFLDISRIAELALLVVAVIQYVKNRIPEAVIKPYLQIALGIFLSWAGYSYVTGVINPLIVPWVKIIVDGLFAALMADFGYNFLSSKPGSPSFSLSSKE